MDRITLEVKYSPGDLQRSYELHYRVFYPIRSRILLILGIFLVVIGVLLEILKYLLQESDWLGKLYIVLGIFSIIYHFWRMSRLGKIMFKKMPDFQLPYKITIDEAGIICKSTTVSSEAAWEHYSEAIVTADMVLIYTNRFKFNLFPKTAFGAGEFEKFSELVSGKVKSVVRK